MQTIYSPTHRELTGQLKSVRMQAGLTQEQAARGIGE